MARRCAAVAALCAGVAHAFAPAPAALRPATTTTARVCARTGPRMQVGGGGLDKLGGDTDAYMKRIQELKEEMASGARNQDFSYVDPRLITENEEVMFETINSPLEEEEVARLKAAQAQQQLPNLDSLLALQEDEDDAEMELALLEMFKEQGDIDAAALPKTGKV